MTKAWIDKRYPPPWLKGDTWAQRAAIVIAGFRAMPDAPSLEGYAKICADVAHAPAEIKARVRKAFEARMRKLKPDERISA
jgi:hypothetical protein